jgi:hypothetical protein
VGSDVFVAALRRAREVLDFMERLRDGDVI